MGKLLSAYRRVCAASGGALVVASAEAGLSPNETRDQPHRYAELRKRQQEVMKASGLAEDPWLLRNRTRLHSQAPTTYEFMNYGFLMGPVGAMHALLTHVVKTVQPGF